MLANGFSLRSRGFVATCVFSCLILLLSAAGLCAREVGGVELPGQVRVEGSDVPLVLNGAGVRRKFFFSIYVGALYLPRRTSDAAEAMSMPGPKRVSMTFTYHEIPAKKLAAAWREGFEENLDPPEWQHFGTSIRRFWSLFPTLRKGDVVTIDQSPEHGVVVRLNGRKLGRIGEPGFMSVLLRIWLGRAPVTDSLKRAMLGDG